jgi:NADH dehydrogenase [ubiquinone] 1 alpha subcomplex assembly factor 7
MTPLGAALARRIAGEGPIPVADYMDAALNHPEFGYYRQREPFGAEGDFTTAPEISQMFGEMIGLFCLHAFEQMGEPQELRLIELGPGRGSLMADLWRTARIRPAFQAAAEIHLVETSPRLRDVQRAALTGIDAWHDDFAGAAADSEAPLLVIANEFFDALPVHQMVQTEAGWRERLVGFDEAAQSFFFTAAARETPACALVPEEIRESPIGSIFEAAPERSDAMAEIAGAVAGRGGAALVIDYGYLRTAAGDTLQAVRAHRFHDVLIDPGTADVTAHVDFAALAEAASGAGAQVFGPATQGEFLRRLGIEARAEALCARASESQARDVESALHRLIDGDMMGNLFKVMAAAKGGLNVAGF